MIDIRGLFTREAIIRRLKASKKIVTPVMDTIFGDRPQLALPIVSADMVRQVVRTMPVVRRGGASISVGGGSGTTAFYEPLAARPNTMVVGADLNNLKILGGTGREAWAAEKQDMLRKTCRKTAEAMAAVALSGRLVWPVQLENGQLEEWEVDFGEILTFDAPKKWDATGDNKARLKDVFETCQAMEEKLQEMGYGGTVERWAGKTAYATLYGLAESHTSTAKMKVEVTEKGINVGGFLIKRRSERHFNPKTKEMVPVVGDNDLMIIATDAGHIMPYCALDDLDANLQPLPFFTKPIKLDDPSGYKLVGESKPFPIPNVDGICKSTVVG